MVFIPPGLLTTAPVLLKKDPETGKTVGEKIIRKEEVRTGRTILKRPDTPTRRSGRRSKAETRARERAKLEAFKREQARIAEAKARAKAARAKALKDFNRRIAETKARLEKQRKRKVVLTKRETASLKAREQLRITAAARGKAFSQSEQRRFLKQRGGNVSALRSARSKGFRIQVPKKEVEKAVGAVVLKKDPRSLRVNIPQSALKNLSNEEARRQTINLKNRTQVNKIIRTDVRAGNFTNRLINIADIVSGGSITERNIDKDQAKLNTRIINFNKKFGGRELSEEQFKRASAEQRFISSQQKKLDKRRDGLANSRRDSLRDLVEKVKPFGQPRLTQAQMKKVEAERKANVKIQADIKKNKPFIDRIENKIESNNKKISAIQNKKVKSDLDRIKLFGLQSRNSNLQNELASLKHTGPPVFVTGTVPIGIPASSIPQGVSKISFVGAQKVGKGGKIVTDIVFKTQKGTVGFAKSASVIKKGKSVSVVAGRFGKVRVELLTGKRKLRAIRTFAGAQTSKSRAAKFTTDQLRKIAKFTQRKSNTKLIRVIKSNIKGLQQSGVGRIVTVKGKKIFKPFIRFPSGKLGTQLSKGANIDDFASVSAVLSKKDISLIVGKSITRTKDKAEFIGLIKSLSGGSGSVTLTTLQKQQYSKALQKLFGSVASAVAKAERSGTATTKALRIASAAALLSKTPVTTARLAAQKVTLKKRTISAVKKPQVSKTKIKQLKTKSVVLQKRRTALLKRQRNAQKIVQRQNKRIKALSKSRTISKTRQQQISRTRVKQRQAQKQLQQLKTRQKLIAKQIIVTNNIIFGRPVAIKAPPVVTKRKKKVKKVKELKKAVKVYNVFGKSRGKFVKLNKVPLTRKDALDKGSFAIDRTLSQTFKISPKGKSKTPGKLLKGEKGYFNKKKHKLRGVRIQKGKKFKLKNKFIEKTKHKIDTKFEKSGLTIQRLLKQQRKKIPSRASAVKNSLAKKRSIPRTARRQTPAQRKKMLAILKRARSARLLKNKVVRKFGRRGVSNTPPTKRKVVRKPVRASTTRKKMTPAQLRQFRINNLKKARKKRKNK